MVKHANAFPDAGAMVLGWGRSGEAAASLLAQGNARVFVVDDNRGCPEDLGPGLTWTEPRQAVDLLDKIATVVVSPGVGRDHPLLIAAQARDLEIISELELGWRALDADRVVAVTGTNGKSTTVTLIAAILEADGNSVFAGGNLGSPLCLAVGRHYDVAVIEVSSFQLEWIDSFCPDVGVLLTIAPDHLDRHGDFETYRETKLRMFANQSQRTQRLGQAPHAVISVEAAADPTIGGKLGVQTDTGLTTFALSSADSGVGSGDTRRVDVCVDRERRVIEAGGGFCVTLGPDWPFAPHDFSNAAAAVAAARLAGAGPEACGRALAEFRPLAHRLELVVGGAIDWWDDSKATNVAATCASLQAFARPVIVLLGGQGKGEDFGPLAEQAQKIDTAVVYGQAASEIEAALDGHIPLIRADNLAQAVGLARHRALAAAAEGDPVAVLLAPACASFDEFSNYAQRGDAFAKLAASQE